MNGTPPTTRDLEWERWRGSVEQQLQGLSAAMNEVIEYVQSERTKAASDAGAKEVRAAAVARRRLALSWMAPNLPMVISSLISGSVAVLALVVALTHSH